MSENETPTGNPKPLYRRIIDSPWPYFIGAGILLVVAIVSQFEIRMPARPQGTAADIAKLRERTDLNVVFLLIDTLRADRLGSYGYARPTSPNLDAMAASGIRFARVVSQSSWTKTSMASFWTSTYPASHGILKWFHAVPEGARMPAEILKEAGLRTAGIYRNGWVAPNFGFAQGFDTYYNPKPSATPAKFQRHNPSAHPLQGNDADVTESAFEFLRTFKDQRFLLYVHYMDVHQYAYDAASQTFGTSYSDVYDNAIGWVDKNVGLLVNELEKLGIADRTVILVGSDHGEAFGEHGIEGHGRNLYREVTEVPAIMVLPFRLSPGIVVQPMVSNMDLWPTVLDMLGMQGQPGAQGRSLLPLIEAAGRGETPPDGAAPSVVYGQLDKNWGRPKQPEFEPIVAVSTERYRMIYPLYDGGRLELFDHSTDPTEQKNLAPDAKEALAELQPLRDAYDASPPVAWGEPEKVEVDAMRLEQLRALGYVIQ